MIKVLYDWTIQIAAHRHAVLLLFLISFAESSFLPIPPDVLLMLMILASREKWLYLFAVCTIASVLGGIAGYGIGFYTWQAVQGWFFEHLFSEQVFAKVQNLYDTYDFWIVFAAAFTPIPYKVFTITAGVMELNLVSFSVASIVGRGARFFLVSWLLYHFGPPVRSFIEKRLGWVTLAFTILLIGGIYAIKFLGH